MTGEKGLDEDLLREAKELTSISDTTEVLDEALRRLIRALESRAVREQRSTARKSERHGVR